MGHFRPVSLMRVLLGVALLLAGCNLRRDGAATLIESLLSAGETDRALALAIPARAQHPDDPAIYRAWLLAQLHDPKLLDREESRALLSGEPVAGLAVRTLTEALRHGGLQARLNGVRVMGRQPGAEAVAQLRYAADDSDPEVRRAAVRELAKRRDPSASTEVLLCLKDSNWSVRAEAIPAYAAIAGLAAVPRIAALLDDHDGYVRFQASKALLELAKPGAEPAFRALSEPGRSGETREVAALALASLGAPDGPALLHGIVINGCSDHRAEAAELLVARWPEAASATFLELLTQPTPDPAVGLVASRFLESKGGERGRAAAAAYRLKFQQTLGTSPETLGSQRRP